MIHCQTRMTEEVQVSFCCQGGDTVFMTIFLSGNLQDEVFQLVFAGFTLLNIGAMIPCSMRVYDKAAKQHGRAEFE